jgi:hypothetical protein
MNPPELIKHIKAHIRAGDRASDKAEEHYKAAGIHLAKLKAQHDKDGGTWAQWEALLKDKVGIRTGRASELMQIADGRKTVAQLREGRAGGMRRIRAQRSSPRGEGHGHPGHGR